MSHPFPAIQDLGVIGDRRTAALVDRRGAIVWCCLPDFASPTAFGALLDPERGGYWRISPGDAPELSSHQDYDGETAVLRTRWTTPHGELERADVMLDPQDDRTDGVAGQRTILRRARCRGGPVSVSFDVAMRWDFKAIDAPQPCPDGWRTMLPTGPVCIWASFKLEPHDTRLRAELQMGDGEEAWMVLTFGPVGVDWSIDRARAAFAAASDYWRGRAADLTYTGDFPEEVRRSALTIHLLTYAPTGSLVAAPTMSLPERMGGDRNYDYRYAWVRDVSLGLALIAMLGNLPAAERFMDWLGSLETSTSEPLQVLYQIDGGLDVNQRERTDIAGYRGSRPVLEGNHAYNQLQIDSLGYLADCAEVYLQQGGVWKPAYGALIQRIADYTAENWREPSNGIWELSEREHYVVGKVMSWVTLDRAIKIAARTETGGNTEAWRKAKDEIHEEVMSQGWCPSRQAFRQRYGSDALDASSLLISLMGFLGPRDPHVLSNLDAITEHLSVDGLVYRFDPRELSRPVARSPQDFEGAFLPCTFWLASARAMAGEPEFAEAIVRQVLQSTPATHLFAEELDPLTGDFLGNMPQLFSHAEFVRAALEISKARPLHAARLLVGMSVGKIKARLSKL